MKKQLTLFAALAIAVLLLATCNKEQVFNETPQLPETPYQYEINENVGTDATVVLGRVLFYDKKLSINNSVSCATCHKQVHGFSDGQTVSTGFGGRTTRRNAPALANLRFYYRFFWDRRASSLHDLVLQPVQDHIEMGMEDVESLIEKLSKVDYYKPLFEEAYGTSEIDADRISDAMADFLTALVSTNSKMDRVDNQEADYTAQERIGRDLFFSPEANCGGCHSGINLGGVGVGNIGLNMEYVDNGIGEISGNNNNNGVFKTPALRNIALTAPYMHDGRFKTLEEVIDHYSDGIEAHPNLSVQLSDDPNCWGCPGPFAPRQRDFSEAEKRALIAFLETMTDYDFISDPKYSDPFDY